MNENAHRTTEILNVYFYALYDADNRQAHSGLTAAICEAAVRSDITGNYTAPRYVTVHRVPELVGIVDERGAVHLMPRRTVSRDGEMISCETCALHGECRRGEVIDGLESCLDWQSGREGKRKRPER